MYLCDVDNQNADCTCGYNEYSLNMYEDVPLCLYTSQSCLSTIIRNLRYMTLS